MIIGIGNDEGLPRLDVNGTLYFWRTIAGGLTARRQCVVIADETVKTQSPQPSLTKY
jgi:hypothetical protein